MSPLLESDSQPNLYASLEPTRRMALSRGSARQIAALSVDLLGNQNTLLERTKTHNIGIPCMKLKEDSESPAF